MPLIQGEKPAAQPEPSATAVSLEKYTGTINNLTDGTLHLINAYAWDGWLKPPPILLDPNTGGEYSSAGNFANPANGHVAYQYQGKGPERPVFQNAWSVPSLSSNHITYTSDPPLQVKATGDPDGYDPHMTYAITKAG